MRPTSCDPPLITLPTVSDDGAVVSGEPRDFTGEPVSEEHAGAYTVLRHPRELLHASNPLPPRLLLTYATRTKATRRRESQVEAVGHALLALVPVIAGGVLLQKMGASKEFSLCAMGAVLAGVMVRGWWKVVSDPEQVSQVTEWLDFRERTWCSRLSFANMQCPPQTKTLLLDELALSCRPHHMEQGTSYEVALCKMTELRFPELGPAKPIARLYSSDDESQARDFARSLGTLWGVKYWKPTGSAKLLPRTGQSSGR